VAKNKVALIRAAGARPKKNIIVNGEHNPDVGERRTGGTRLQQGQK